MEFFHKYGIFVLGFGAQAMFGARLIIQWIHSEKQGRVTSPTIYWQFSLLGSFLFLLYGIIRDDVVIIVGQTLSYFIYIRNLQLKNDWQKFGRFTQYLLLIVPALTVSWMLIATDHSLQKIFLKTDLTHPIIIMGAAGQLLLNLRFVYQWYYSEKRKSSILPLGFWIISMIASVLILIYASYRIDPVLLVSQGVGIFAYSRNIFIHFKKDSAAHYL